MKSHSGFVIIDENQISPSQHLFIKQYFIQKISPALVTIILSDLVKLPLLKDSAAYLSVHMKMNTGENQYALIEISKNMDRFVVLPREDNKDYIIMLDDLLRYCLTKHLRAVVPSLAPRRKSLSQHKQHLYEDWSH